PPETRKQPQPRQTQPPQARKQPQPRQTQARRDRGRQRKAKPSKQSCGIDIIEDHGSPLSGWARRKSRASKAIPAAAGTKRPLGRRLQALEAASGPCVKRRSGTDYGRSAGAVKP